jgi:hypothetical protein
MDAKYLIIIFQLVKTLSIEDDCKLAKYFCNLQSIKLAALPSKD